MREFVKSTVSLPWSLSLFGVEQLTNLLIPQNSGKATAAFDTVTQATGEQLSELVLTLYSVGDNLQRDMTDWAFRLLTPEVFNPWSDVNSEILRQSAEIWRNLDPVQGGWLTFQELQNKAQVFSLVRNIPTTLQLASQPPYPPLPEIVQRAYAMDLYPALWAVEGVGHWYGDTFFTRQEVPRGILRDAKIRDLPEESLTMLNAGIGISLAQQRIKTVNHLSSPADIRNVLGQITALCRDNATPGYEGAALESLGLITQNGEFYGETRPDQMVQMVSRELEHMDPEAFEYFWRGAGRAHYFLPINFVPGYGSVWHAFRMIRQAVPNDRAWLNAIAGLAWGFTMTNIRHPQIVANFVQYHGAQVAADNAFANGVASSLMMRYDTTPGAPFIHPFYQYQPDSANSQLVQLWHDLVQQPATVALQEYYPILKQHHCLGEIFRYHDFPDLMYRLARSPVAMSSYHGGTHIYEGTVRW
jgi:hypothetical protein